jgi:hypothetical protein
MKSAHKWLFYLKPRLYLPLLILALDLNQLTAQSKPDYFPMHLGDMWIYKLTTGAAKWHWANQVTKIIDTTIVQQKRYFVFEEKTYDVLYDPGKVHSRLHYYRKATNGDVMKFSLLLQQEQLYYTFQIDSLRRTYVYSGDFDLIYKWKIAFYDTSKVKSSLFGISTSFYEYAFGFGINDGVVFTVWRTLAANFGFVAEHGEGDSRILVGAHINGKAYGDLSVAVTNEPGRVQAPLVPTLSSNYPNPFQHTTRIGYNVPSFWAQPIRIAVYDLAGREIALLVRESLSRGHHEILWDGKDKHGRTVSNGVYLLRLTSGSYTETIKTNYLR